MSSTAEFGFFYISYQTHTLCLWAVRLLKQQQFISVIPSSLDSIVYTRLFKQFIAFCSSYFIKRNGRWKTESADTRDKKGGLVHITRLRPRWEHWERQALSLNRRLTGRWGQLRRKRTKLMDKDEMMEICGWRLHLRSNVWLRIRLCVLGVWRYNSGNSCFTRVGAACALTTHSAALGPGLWLTWTGMPSVSPSCQPGPRGPAAAQVGWGGR